MPGIALSDVGRHAGALGERLSERDLMRAVAGQRRDNGVLHRTRTAEPAVGQLLHRGQRIVQARRRADDEPSRPPSRSEVRLRQARQRNDRRVAIERAEQRHGAIEAELAVHLVRENRQPVLFRDVEQRAADGGG